MRKILVFVAAIAAVAAWLSFDRESAARQQLSRLWSGVQSMFAGEPEKPETFNWGDVAEKVGEFTREERGLREVLRPGGERETPEATPASVEAPTAAAPAADAPAAEAPSAEAPAR